MWEVGSIHLAHTIDACTSVITLKAKAIKVHDVPATLTLLSFANRLLKSSSVLGAFAVAVSPAIVTGVCYREVVEREIVVAEEVL